MGARAAAGLSGQDRGLRERTPQSASASDFKLRCTVGVITIGGAARDVEAAAALPRVRSSTPHTDT
jgi:hypothetical protein